MKFNHAILLSFIVHIGLVGLFVFSYQFSKIEQKQSAAPQSKINAKAINSKRVDQLVKKLKREQLDKKKNEVKRLNQLKKAEQASKRNRKEEERKADKARKQRKAAEKKRKLEEKKAADLKKKRLIEEKSRKKKAAEEKKKKAEQARKRKAEEKRRKEKEAEKKRKAKAEAERKKKAAEEKARQEAVEREMQAQMDAEAAELLEAYHQQVMSEVSKYAALIKGKIYRNWINPERTGSCLFKVKVSQGGLVIGVTVLEGNTQHCESGQRAIYKSEPLPVSKDPDVFAKLKSINLTLKNEVN